MNTLIDLLNSMLGALPKDAIVIPRPPFARSPEKRHKHVMWPVSQQIIEGNRIAVNEPLTLARFISLHNHLCCTFDWMICEEGNIIHRYPGSLWGGYLLELDLLSWLKEQDDESIAHFAAIAFAEEMTEFQPMKIGIGNVSCSIAINKVDNDQTKTFFRRLKKKVPESLKSLFG